MKHPSRRLLLGGAVTLPAVATAIAAQSEPIPAVHPDAVLMAMVTEAMRLDQASFDMTIDLTHDDPNRRAALDESRRLMDIWRELRNAIVATPAKTTDGLLAKVRMAHALFEKDENDQPGPDDAVAFSLCLDLHQVLGGRVLA